MNKLAIAFLAVSSIAAFGCKKKGGGSDMMASYEKYVDGVCKCADMACVSKEGETYAKANAEANKNPDPEAAKKMAEDPKFQELTKRMTECTTKLATAGAGGAAGAAGGTPPAGGAAPAGGTEGSAAAAGGTPPAGGTEGSAAAPAGGTPPAGGAEGSAGSAK